MQRRKRTTEELIELVVVIMLGITAVATAWASWQGGLHGSQMDQKYTRANHLASEGNSEYVAAVQVLTQDMMLYNEINSLLIDLMFAESIGDDHEAEKLEWKIDELVTGNASDEFVENIVWAMDMQERTGDHYSPFDVDGYVDSYFEYAFELLAESEELLAAGDENNTNSDNQGLVTVLYAVVLFLLGISSSFKGMTEKFILLGVSAVGFLGATIFMFTIPIVMP